MKTSKFKRAAEELGTLVKHSDFSAVYTVISKNVKTVYGYINTVDHGFVVTNHAPTEVAELIVSYGMTPLEEREEEKKYRYKFKPSIKSGGGGEDKVFHLARFLFREDLKLDASGSGHAKSSESFHFTDKEVEEFTDEQKLLIQLCEKIEVTP